MSKRRAGSSSVAAGGVSGEADLSSLIGRRGIAMLLGLVGGGEPFECVDGGAPLFVVGCESLALEGSTGTGGPSRGAPSEVCVAELLRVEPRGPCRVLCELALERLELLRVEVEVGAGEVKVNLQLRVVVGGLGVRA